MPVYNVAPWLSRGLNSLINQTLPEIEIICIDDKSTDNSLSILLKYQKNNSNIHVIPLKTNGGVSVARNAGLAIARGEYVGFMDPDDFVDADFYEKLYIAAHTANADMSKGERRSFDDNGRASITSQFSKIARNKAHFQGAFTSAIFRHTFLKKHRILFPVGVITAQDDVFLTMSVLQANKVVLVPGSFYNYIRRENSLNSDYLNFTKVQSKIRAITLIIEFINKLKLDTITYDITCSSRLDWILFNLFYRNTSQKSRLFVIKSAMKLFKKCHSPELLNSLDADLWNFLFSGDEAGLMLYLLKHKGNEKKISLFKTIPLITIKRRKSRTVYRLFGCIPFFVKTARRKLTCTN